MQLRAYLCKKKGRKEHLNTDLADSFASRAFQQLPMRRKNAIEDDEQY